MQLSERALKMPESPIRKLAPLAENAIQQGEKVYRLNIGQPDITTPENVLKAIRSFPDKIVKYSHSAGIQSYRKKMAKYYEKLGVDIDYKQILITTGGSEAIKFAFMTCLNPDDEVVVPEPFYTNYNAFAMSSGISLVPITSSIEDGFALPPISKFKEVFTSKTKAVLICNPNNPTGYLYSKEELSQLRDLVKDKGLFLFSDEVYREFCYQDDGHYSVLRLKGIEQNTVVFDSVSKRYSACGLRIGAMLSKNKEIISNALKYAQARLSPPTVGQVAGEVALDTPKKYFDDVNSKYVARRDYVISALNNMEGVFAPTPKGAFYTIIRLPIDDSNKFCRWLLEEFDHNNETIMLAPASGFYATPGLGNDEVRLAYVLNIEELKSAMECLEVALRVYPGRTINKN